MCVSDSETLSGRVWALVDAWRVVAASDGRRAGCSFLSPSSRAMSKPTLFQALLGRPSQTYYFPPAKEYHSAKHDLFRAVSPTDRDPLPQPTSAIHSSPDSPPSAAGLALRDPSPSRSSLSPSSVSRPRRRAEAAHTRAGTPVSYFIFALSHVSRAERLAVLSPPPTPSAPR